MKKRLSVDVLSFDNACRLWENHIPSMEKSYYVQVIRLSLVSLTIRRLILGLLLIAHGWVHVIFQFEFINTDTGEHIGWNGTSWLLTNVLDDQIVLLIGRIFWGAAMVLFILAGIAVLMKHRNWRYMAVSAAAVSLSSFILFWNGLVPYPLLYVLGPTVAVGILIALPILRWPPDSWIFKTKGE